jgi:4-aminobutyrate aminotransferase-like enzyme
VANGKPLDAKSFKKVLADIAANGVILTKCGAASLRFAPAHNITREQLDEALEQVFDVLAEQ